MSFLDTSVVNATVANKGATAVAQAQKTIAIPITAVSTNVSSSVATAVRGPSVVSSGGLGGTSLNNAASTAVNNFIQSAIKSISGTLGSSKTGLASGISPPLSKVFTNTNIPSASNTVSRVSDPVNVLSLKNPASSAFRVTSASPGSQTVDISGANSKFGSGADAMTGTILSTVLNRFNLDSASNLLSSITNSFTGSKVSGLFASLNVDPAVSAAVTGVNATDLTAFVKNNTFLTDNDLNNFLGNSASLNNALGGGQDFSSFFQTNNVYSLINQNGQAVSTNGSGVDATTANAILGILNLAGCGIADLNYSSFFEKSSLFNLGLNLSALNGMKAEVEALLGCSHASTMSGQQSIINAFLATSGSQLEMADTVLSHVDVPSSVNNDYLNKTIVTNPRLRSTDVTTLDSVFGKLGTTTTKAVSVPTASSSSYPVYDVSLLSATQPSLVSGIFGDTTIVDYFNSSPMTLQKDGRLALG